MDQTTQNILQNPDVRNLLLIMTVIISVAWWKIFEKVGVEGWKAIIPFYNVWILAQIAGRPGWLGLAMVLCAMTANIGVLAALVIQIIIYSDLAKAFGKGLGFTVGLMVLPVVFFPIIAFDKSTYR